MPTNTPHVSPLSSFKREGMKPHPQAVLRLLSCSTLLTLCSASFQVEVLSTVPYSLINRTHPGVTQNISGGFETGLVVKTDDGAYHMFSVGFPPGPDWGSDIMLHWTSPDGVSNWQPVQELANFHFSGGLWYDPVSPMPFFNDDSNRWEFFFMWQAQPKRTWTANGTAYRMLSQTPGRGGINGPWTQDPVPVLSHASNQLWEMGMQDSISFPYRTPDGRWVVFYGSGPRMCCADWFVGLAGAAAQSGPFTRLVSGNPVTMLPMSSGGANYTENPTVYALPNGQGFVAVFDPLFDEVTTGSNLKIGFGFSKDGVNWLAEEGAAVTVTEQGEPFWAKVIRTPLGMVEEGDGTFSVFFTAEDGHGWAGLGLARVRFTVT